MAPTLTSPFPVQWSSFSQSKRETITISTIFLCLSLCLPPRLLPHGTLLPDVLLKEYHLRVIFSSVYLAEGYIRLPCTPHQNQFNYALRHPSRRHRSHTLTEARRSNCSSHIFPYSNPDCISLKGPWTRIRPSESPTTPGTFGALLWMRTQHCCGQKSDRAFNTDQMLLLWMSPHPSTWSSRDNVH